MVRQWVAGVVALVAWGLTVSAGLAAARPDWYPSDEVIAAQQARIAAEHKAALAYYQREILGSYEFAGKRSPQWAPAMRKVLQAIIEERIGGNPDGSILRRVAINDAVPLQIQDPLYAYFWTRTMAQSGNIQPKDFRRYAAMSAPALAESAHSAILRFHATIRHAQVQVSKLPGDLDEPDFEEAKATLKKALSVLDEAADANDMPACEMYMILDIAQEGSRSVYRDRWKWTEEVYNMLVKHFGETASLQAGKGNIFTAYAWDARGTGFANTVTPEGWRLMRERLGVAEKELTAAWNKDPQCAIAASGMLVVEKGQGKGRDVMELWFRRAVAADASRWVAYDQKRDYLAGKWYGSDQEMIEFTREVAAALPKTWRMRLMVWDAHEQILCHHMPLADINAMNEVHWKETKAYFRANPEAWEEMKAIADDVCLAPGAAIIDRLKMARVAVAAGDAPPTRSYLAGIDASVARCHLGQEYERVTRELAAIKPATKKPAREKVTFP